MSYVQSAADRLVHLSESASLEELAYFAEVFESCRLRLPLRESLPLLVAKLKEGPGPEAVPLAIRMITSYGRASLFVSELFDYLADNLASMKASEISTFAYECGRHGLRTRHHTERVAQQAVAAIPQMTLPELMRTWQGFLRFSRDRRAFYQAARSRMKAELSELTAPQLLLVLRAAKDLMLVSDRGHQRGFMELHAATCAKLHSILGELSPTEEANVLGNCSRRRQNSPQAMALMRAIAVKWTSLEDLSPLRVVEVVDSLQAFAILDLNFPVLFSRLDELLVDRKLELRYAGNVGLWGDAVQTFAKLGVHDAKWPLVTIDLARDPHFLGRVGHFEHTTYADALSRLRRYDEVVFDNLADAVISGLSLFREDVAELAKLLVAFSMVGRAHEALFQACYDHLLDLMEREVLNLGSRQTSGALVQLAWSFVFAGLHRQHESFAAVLDYTFFVDLDGSALPVEVQRLMQIADAVLLEAPEAAANCQFPEKLEAARSDSRARRVVTDVLCGDPRLQAEVVVALQKLGWKHTIGHEPEGHPSSVIHISLEPQLGRKVGLLFAGPLDMVRCGLPEEGLPMRETGVMALSRRLLAARGWKTSVVTAEHWGRLSSPDERRRFLEELAAV